MQALSLPIEGLADPALPWLGRGHTRVAIVLGEPPAYLTYKSGGRHGHREMREEGSSVGCWWGGRWLETHSNMAEAGTEAEMTERHRLEATRGVVGNEGGKLRRLCDSTKAWVQGWK